MGEYLNIARISTSSARYLDINLGAGGAPAPTLGALSSVARWAGQQTLAIAGTGFDATVVAYANGSPLVTTYISPTSASAVLPASYLWNPDAVSITAKTTASALSTAQSLAVAHTAADRFEFRVSRGRTMSGSNIQVLANQIGADSNSNISQLTAGLQPVLSAADAGYNGKDIATMALKRLTSGTFATPVAATSTHFFVGEITATAAAVQIYDGLASYRQVLIGLANGTMNTPGLTSVTTAYAKRIWCTTYASSGSFRVNAKTATDATGSSVGTQMSGANLGTDYTGGYGFTGKFAHWIAIDGVVSDARRGEIMDFLAAEYGVTVAA